MSKDKQPEKNYFYFDMTTNERDSALRFLLTSILKTRESHPFLKRKEGSDEDVNVYLAHLLFAVALPEYHEMADPYLSKHSSDVMTWVNGTEDRTIRYFIYKVNADHLLIHSTLFQDLKYNGKNKSFFRSPEEYYRELAMLYYTEAAKYHQQMNRKKTGVGRVLEKVAADFGYYQRILEIVRDDYFAFMNSFREKHFNNFLSEVSSYEKDNFYDEKMDEFLAAFYEWNQAQNEAMRAKVEQLAADLKRINPEFSFDLSRGRSNKSPS